MREISRKYRPQLLAITAGLIILTVVAIKFGFSKTIRIRTYTVFVKQLPDTVFWSWEHPEDLSFLKANNSASKIGIAYLAKTLLLKDDNVSVRPRLQPLAFPEGATLIAVVRIETDRSGVPDLSTSQRATVAAQISDLARQKNVAAVQIDFDAKQSERTFYRNLIVDLRHDWPDRTGLSITALASWCISDTWIKDLPIDDAVPMLFRMGADNSQI